LVVLGDSWKAMALHEGIEVGYLMELAVLLVQAGLRALAVGVVVL